MRKTAWLTLLILTLSWAAIIPVGAAAQEDTPSAVRAVLFFSPTCPHCHDVIDNLLLPMLEEYGDQLLIIGIDTTQEDGGMLYQSAIDHFEVPPERRGVPTLVVNETVLVGSGEIPAEFPGIVEEGLSNGGIDWPKIPGLNPENADRSATAQAESEPTPAEAIPTVAPTEVVAAPAEPTEPEAAAEVAAANTPVSENSLQNLADESLNAEAQLPPPDPVGTALAAIILTGMVIALIFTGWRAAMGLSQRQVSGQSALIPILSILGLAVAGYLAYVEISRVEAVCGPVGHCNIVQSSPYAQIMGIPIAVLGLLNYAAIIGLWGVQKFERGPMVNSVALLLLGLTVFGTIFSIYLTLLEIFVIHAVCAWCLSSAVITTLLMLLAALPLTKRADLQNAPSY